MEILSLVKHFFIPRHSNNHKSKALHPSSFIFYALFLVLIQFSIIVFQKIEPSVLGYASNIAINDLFTLTNQKRMDNGLSPLVLNTQLNNAAAGKARDMFTKNYWAHNAPDGTSPWVFVTGAGYNYLYAGENLAKDFGDSVGVVNAWMDSPTHKANILNDKYKEIGFAVENGSLNGGETTLVVQFFGTRPSEPAKTSDEAANSTLPPPKVIQPTPTAIVNRIIPTPTTIVPISPTKVPMILKEEPKIPPTLKEIPLETSAFDPFEVTKNASLILVIVLLIILCIDGIVVYKNKVRRLSGHNIAHVTYLLILLLSMYMLERGSIL